MPEIKRIAASNWIFIGLILALICLKAIYSLLPTQALLPSQQTLLTWTAVFTVIGLGLIGLYLSRLTGFPRLWDTAVTTRERLLIPAVVGLVLGIVWILLETSGTYDIVRATLPGNKIHTPLPLALITYPAGALILEIILRLFCIPLLVWLISNLLLGGRGQDMVFWLAAALVAFIEPLALVGPVLQTGIGLSTNLFLLFAFSYLANLIFAYLFRSYGFLAPVSGRLSFYTIWHVVFAGLI